MTNLLQCPYGHESEFERQTGQEVLFASTNDLKVYKVTTTITCFACKRQFQTSRLRTVVYYDDMPVDQISQNTEIFEVNGPWHGTTISVRAVDDRPA